MSASLDTVFSTFIKFQIGGVDVTYTPPKYVMSANITRSCEITNNVQMTLYDDGATYIEDLIVANGADTELFLQYGYAGGKQSPVMRMMLLDYTLDFVAGGYKLNLTLTTISVGSLGMPRTKSFWQNKPSDIVIDIANTEGWKIGYIEPTTTIASKTSTVSGSVTTNVRGTPGTPGTAGIQLSGLLRYGSTGSQVKTLQRGLEDKGYSVGTCGIDGWFGKDTKAAVVRFQTDQRIAVDAIVGPITWGRLFPANPGTSGTSNSSYDTSVTQTTNLGANFIQSNQPSLDYIRKCLIPMSISASRGVGNYQLYFHERDGKTYVNFSPNRFEQRPIATYEYTVNSPTNGQVLSFSPTFSGSVRALAMGGFVTGHGYDTATNQSYFISYDYNSNSRKIILGPAVAEAMTLAKRCYDFGNKSIDAAYNEMINKWFQMSDSAYEATLEIMGDPTLRTQETVSILVYDKNGRPHHTSGIYLIKTVEDSVEGGEFTSTLTLVRNASNFGINVAGVRNM
jgi:peptidoglycan hydrolase-like protein with peptidoglycan-binding domain